MRRMVSLDWPHVRDDKALSMFNLCLAVEWICFACWANVK